MPFQICFLSCELHHLRDSDCTKRTLHQNFIQIASYLLILQLNVIARYAPYSPHIQVVKGQPVFTIADLNAKSVSSHLSRHVLEMLKSSERQ